MSRAESGGPTPAPDLRWLPGALGVPAAKLVERLGPPAADRGRGSQRWLAWRWEGLSLRVRCAAGVGGRVASWTASLGTPAATLRAAAEPLGLWPACAPDASADTVREPLVRRAVRDPVAGATRSLTASVRAGRVTTLTLFDEPPEWL